MEIGYWHQKATPWVSFTVLAGGLATALILFFVVKVESSSQFLAGPDLEAIVDSPSTRAFP